MAGLIRKALLGLTIVQLPFCPAFAGAREGIPPRPLDRPQLNALLHEAQNLRFLAPNEYHPLELARTFAQPAEGAYVAVGTERALMGAIMNSGATSIWQIDANPAVVLFNRINRALLQLAKGRLDYRELRMSESFERWRSRLKEGPLALDEASARLLASREIFTWWSRVMRHPDFGPFNRDLAFIDTMGRASYLRDDESFARIQKLAKAGKIFVEGVDLADPARVNDLLAKLRSTGTKVGALDLSNAWWSSHIPRDALSNLLRSFRDRTNETSMLVLTHFERRSWSPNTFGYVGVPFSQFGTETQLAALLDRLNEMRGYTRFIDDGWRSSLAESLRKAAFQAPAPTTVNPIEQRQQETPADPRPEGCQSGFAALARKFLNALGL